MRRLVAAWTSIILLIAPAVTHAAIVIDDFNVATSASAVDPSLGSAGTGVTVVGPPSSEGTLVGGDAAWSRSLYAELNAGDRVSTDVCASCQDAHISADANSSGHYDFRWSGPAKDLSANTHLQFRWSSDVAGNGTQVWVEVSDGAQTAVSAPIVLSPPAQVVDIVLPAFTGPGAGYAGVTSVALRFSGTLAVDGNIDDVVLIARSIDLRKFVSVDDQATFLDADVPTGPSALPGSNVFFKLIVTNTGDETLTTIVLSDTDFPTAACSIPGALAPAASFTCVLGPVVAINGQHSNTATVTALGQVSGTPVSDSDPAHYVGFVVTRIDIEKLVSVDNQATFEDADAAPGPATSVGASVFFRLVVTNTGGETLTAIALTDTEFDTSACAIPTTLAPGDSFTCVLGSRVASAGRHVNTASVQAHGLITATAVGDSDPANYVAATTTTVGIPTLSEWGRLVLSAVLAAVGLMTLSLRGRR